MARALMNSRVVLLLCGSFNPPTILHLRMFERARDFLQQELHCTVLAGLISPVSDQFSARKPTLAPAEHRLRMVELATESSDWIRADGWECQREEGWTRTIEVLKHHKLQMERNFPDEENRRIRLVLLCGGDLVDSFTAPDESSPTGKLWSPAHLEEITSADYGLLIVQRTGATARRTLESKELAFLHGRMDNVAIVEDETFPNEMSSTRLRAAISVGRSIRYCTTDSVVNYIRENGLYTREWEELRSRNGNGQNDE